MEANAYDKMVRFAQVCLPKSAFLEAGDIVNDAYLNVGYKDSEAFRKEIRRLAHEQKGATSGFVPFDKMHFKDNALVETSQVCRRCSQEKAIDDFRLITKGNSPTTFRRSVCKSCSDKKYWANVKADPARLERNNERQKINYWLRHPNGWGLTLERIKDQLSTCDWSILEKKLAENNLLPEVVNDPAPIKPTRRWTHNEIDLLQEYADCMDLSQMCSQLKRPESEVQHMLASLGVTHK